MHSAHKWQPISKVTKAVELGNPVTRAVLKEINFKCTLMDLLNDEGLYNEILHVLVYPLLA